jgi:hypothetical protein
LAPQTNKTFEQCSFWRNIPILPMPSVIFQLKKIKKNKNQNQKIKKFKKFKKIQKNK